MKRPKTSPTMLTTETHVLNWHPKFRRFYTSPEALVLISEQENYFLTGEEFAKLVKLVDGKNSQEALLTQCNNFYQSLVLQETIKGLLDKQLLVAHSSDEGYVDGLSTRFKPSVLNNEDSVIYKLSRATFGEKFISNLRLSSDVILADDYLHPQLRSIAKTHLQQQKPLLLLKLTGENFFVGPYLSMQANTPCWECMASQMLRNQPVKQWLQAKENIDYLPLPVLVNNEPPNTEKLAPVIRQAMAEPHTLFEVNPQDFTVKKHHVNHRSQCSTCGNSNLVKQQILQPVMLKISTKNLLNDGGSRMVSPETTVQALKPFISPLTGVITHLTTLPQTINSSVKIHHTAFFRTPPVHKPITGNTFVQASLGKGIVPEQSQASALCETIERYAAQYQGDEFWLKSTPDNLNSKCYLPQQLTDFSKTQYQQFTNEHYSSKYAVKKYSKKVPLHWTQGWSFTHQEKAFIPFTYCFANTPFEESEQYIRWGSNGCAAGNTLEEAILQGFYELIERDAVAIWWYNKTERQAVNLNGLPLENLQKFNQTLGKEWHYWVLDISHDFGVPVMAGIAQHKISRKFCLGFGCHLNPTIACQRALSELCQLLPVRNQNKEIFDFDAIEEDTFLLPNDDLKSLTEFVNLGNPTIDQDIQYCVNQARQFDLEVLVVNYSRPDLPVKTAKVIVPGLCHIWPQLSHRRLYDVPVKMGWLDNSKTESELNQQYLYI